VRVIEKKMSDTALGKQVLYSVVSTPDNIANLDAGRNDAGFWAGVREGTISTDEGLSQVRNRPAFTWVTATPHGAEPAAGEASMRLLYEMAARLDCSNARRLRDLTTFIVPATNPDGRDLIQRATAWGFDPNRDRGTRVNMENDGFTAAIVKYPGVFVIDAHQQNSGYFFPPNTDAVHHEVSQFAIDFIQHDIGPALQRMFNDQSVAYQNYSVYDLFAPIYGDSVPALLDGAAGMTYEKGSSENYGKQVYDHYLAMDATENITSDQKVDVLSGWVKQWGEAREQGEECVLQPNKLVSIAHTQVFVQPDTTVCGYYFPPGRSSGDTARLMHELTTTGVHIYRTNNDAVVYDAHNFGPTGTKAITLPKGSIWIPMAQGQKHWIQAILGENPYLPFPYNYDVTQWSYPMTRGIVGSGFLKSPLPEYVSLTEITDPNYGVVSSPGSAVYAFDTDASQAMGLLMELQSKGATVYRAGASFSAANHKFVSGAALVDGSSLGGIDIAALAAQRETPIYGMAKYPVERYAIPKPKIALFTNTASTANPAQVGGAAKGACANPWCEALFVLNQKMRIPASLITPVTLADVAAGKLVTDGYTAFVNPASNIAVNATNQPALDAIRAFVTAGGRYIGTSTNGTTTARNAKITSANTQAISANFSTPGSLYDGAYDTTDPLAWGYDNGGWIYRDLGNNATYDPATMTTPDGSIPDTKVAVKYGPVQASTGQMYNYGFDVDARGPGQLPNRPAMLDQPYGQGRALLLGTNAFYRAWIDGEERMVANGILFPLGGPIAPNASAAQIAAAAEPVGTPIPASTVSKQAPKANGAGRDTSKDLLIKVKRSQAAALKRAVKSAKLPKKLRAKVRYVNTRTTTTLVMRNVRGEEAHDRAIWTMRIIKGLESRRVRAITAQV
jgi:hypothetical protein